MDDISPFDIYQLYRRRQLEMYPQTVCVIVCLYVSSFILSLCVIVTKSQDKQVFYHLRWNILKWHGRILASVHTAEG